MKLYLFRCNFLLINYSINQSINQSLCISRVALPFSQDGVSIERVAAYLRIRANLGLVVFWNLEDALWVCCVIVCCYIVSIRNVYYGFMYYIVFNVCVDPSKTNVPLWLINDVLINVNHIKPCSALSGEANLSLCARSALALRSLCAPKRFPALTVRLVIRSSSH